MSVTVASICSTCFSALNKLSARPSLLPVILTHRIFLLADLPAAVESSHPRPTRMRLRTASERDGPSSDMTWLFSRAALRPFASMFSF
jgi:hypothetical protein